MSETVHSLVLIEGLPVKSYSIYNVVRVWGADRKLWDQSQLSEGRREECPRDNAWKDS